MKFLLQFIFYILITTSLSAQIVYTEELSNEQARTFVDSMKSIASRTAALHCEFEQKKHVAVLTDVAISCGTMHYEAPATLRWIYTMPQKLAMEMQNDKLSFSNAQGEINMPAQAKKSMGSVTELIMNMINGLSLGDNKNYLTKFYFEGRNIVLVKLIPQKARIKKSFSTINLRIDKKRFVAQSIELIEKNCDKTVITFSNVKVKFK